MLNENFYQSIDHTAHPFVIVNGSEYQKAALITANHDLRPCEQLINGALGLCGESGECADLVKKCFMQGHQLDADHIAKELGDCMWYIALIADAIGYDLSEIMQMNIDKLRARYPEGFAVDRSVNRKKGDI